MNAEAAIRRVFEDVLDDGTPWRHPNAPILVMEVKGRCVRVALSGAPTWADLAHELLGATGACEEFRLVGRDLYARMKTPEQRAADAAAIDYDDAHGEFCTHGFPDLGSMLVKKAAQPTKAKKHGPLYTAIADHIEASGETTFMRGDLLAEVRASLEKDGREVRSDNLARTLDKQIIGTLLEVVPDTDGGELQLKDDES